MSDKHYIGLGVTSFENTGKHKPISRVTLFVDSKNYYTAGNDTGKEISASCPSATQEMADALLAKMSGYEYQSFEAGAANIDPAAELGDGVTVGSVYGVLSRMNDDGYGYSGISAPGEPEVEDEYPFQSPFYQELKRESTEIYSVISKTAEEIRLEVQNEVKGLSSSFTVELDSIRGEIVGLENAFSEMELTLEGYGVRIQDAEGNIAELELTLDGLTTRIQDVEGNVAELELTTQEFSVTLNSLEGEYTELSLTLDGLTVTDSSGTTRIKGSSVETGTLYVNAANITGTLTASQIDATNLKVSAANITGTLTANQVNLTGAIAWSDLSSAVQGDIDEAWDMAYDAQSAVGDVADVVDSWSYTYGGKTYIDGEMLMTGTVYASYLMGGEVGILNASGREIGYITVGSSTSSGLEFVSAGNMHLESAECFITMEDDEIRVSCGYFCPQGTAPYLGHSSVGMWEAVYAYTSTIQTSDRNLKNSIEELDKRYLKFILWLVPHRYKMNNGTSDRYHVGFIAQDVLEGMELFEIDSLEFAGFIRDVDADGNEILMLRYEEFIGLLALALQDHEVRLLKLEATV